MMYWQEILVSAAIAIAAAYVGRRMWRSLWRRSHAGCGACGTCAASESPKTVDGKPLVELK